MPAATVQLAKPSSPLAAIAGAQIFALLSDPTRPCVIPLPGKLTFEGKKFRVLASGKGTSVATTTTVTASLYAANAIPAANPLAPASWKLLGASTARVVNTATAAWLIEAELLADSISGLLQGNFTATVNNLVDAKAAIANQLTGLNLTNMNVTQPGPVIVGPQDPAAFFAVGLTFGVAAPAGTTGILSSLTLEF